MDPVFRYFERKAFGHGLRGRSTWLVLGAAVWMINRARRNDRLVYRTKIQPGDRFTISSSTPSTPAR
jgi:hypothetical protein